MQIIGGTLRMAGSGEDYPRIVLENDTWKMRWRD